MAKPKHFYTNIDINSVVTPFLNSASTEDNIAEKTLWPFVDVYAGTQITDVLFDIFCQYSATDTVYWSSYADKFQQRTENGIPVDYYGRYCGLYAFNKRFGLDPYAVWFRRCRDVGLHPWISIRMDDTHCPDEEAVFLRSDFFYEAKEKGWMVGDAYGYYRRAFDYSVPEVRAKMAGYIAEQLDRYDVDGLELDYSREMICFDYVNNPDCARILNGFMREIKEIVRKAEEKHGHPIRIGVRLMRDIAQNLVYGMDAETWVREGLVDLIVVCPRWASCDSDMPIAAWKAAFPEVEISAGITDLVHCAPAAIPLSPAVVGGYALRYLSDGADSVYLFNFFINPKADNSMTRTYTAINKTCGKADTILESPYRHVVTYQDIAPVGYTPWNPMPLTDGGELAIRVGQIPADRTTAILLGFSAGCPEDLEITVNGQVYSRWTACTHGGSRCGSAPSFRRESRIVPFPGENAGGCCAAHCRERKAGNQQSYTNYVALDNFGVVVTAQDLEIVGAVAEGLAVTSKEMMEPAYLDVYVENKLLRDEESVKVAKLMMESACIDFTRYFDFANGAITPVSMMNNIKDPGAVVSHLTSVESKAVAMAEEFFAIFFEE